MKNRVVITGLGVVSSIGSNVSEFKDSLFGGLSGIQHIPELKDFGFRCQVGGIAKLPNTPSKTYTLHRLETMSNFIQLASVAGVEAWENAGLSIPEIDNNLVDWDTGIIIGTGTPAMDMIGNKIIPLTNEKKVRRIGGYGALNIMGSGPSSVLSSILATGNLSVGNSSACCTGTDAIIEGYHRIKAGRAKRMVVGGTEGYSPYKWASLDAMRVLNSQKNEVPIEASRPMSATASGFVPASGAGVLILESLESALQRGAPIVAEILSGFSNSGGQRNGGTSTFPNNEGVLRCIDTAIQQAGISMGEVDAINGHLTGTKADPNEIRNWAQQFKGEEFPLINATKSLIGHSLGASGAIESVASILQIDGQFMHPSLNCEDLHPKILDIIPENRIVRETIENLDLRVLVKSSFGFGDVNATVVYKKYE